MEQKNEDLNFRELNLENYNLPTLWRKNTPYFNKHDAIIFLDYCLKHNIFILGIEGFKLDGDYIIPDSNFIADFSDLYQEGPQTNIEESILYSKQFLSLPQHYDVMFEFVITR